MIRRAREDDLDGIWRIFEPIVREGATYAIPMDADLELCRRIMLDQPEAAFVAELDGQVVGAYYLKGNAGGNGDHVANCGYMVGQRAQGRGIGRQMALHSLAEAKRRGYEAMQFNLVIATNTGAIALWESLGFKIVGRVPEAFRHPEHGLVEALVMWRSLADV